MLLNKIRNLIGTGVVKLFYPDRELQEAQVKMQTGETRDELEHAMPYGFSHLPHTDSEAITLFPGGDRGFGIVINVHDRRYRFKLNQAGEVALYDDLGQSVHLTRNGIVLTSPQKITIDAPETHIPNTLTVGDDAVINGKSFNNHYHELSGNPTTEPKV